MNVRPNYMITVAGKYKQVIKTAHSQVSDATHKYIVQLIIINTKLYTKYTNT